MSNEELRRVLIHEMVELNRPSWENAFGINGRNSDGETLKAYIETQYPPHFIYFPRAD